MAMCSWHHTYKVTYETKKANGWWSGYKIEYVEAATSGMAAQQVIQSYGGPLECRVWKAEQVD